MTKDDYKYPITYLVSADEPKSAAELKEMGKDWGGTDAVLVASILYADSGASSTMWVHRDGRTKKKLTDDQLFMAWATLTDTLVEQCTDLGPGRRRLLEFVMQELRESVKRSE